MPKEYPTEIVQPLGNHNKEYPCIHTREVEKYLKLPFDYLNPVQSDYLPYNEDDDTNIVVASGTSSGKTLIAELFAARAISMGKRVLYVCPMKALADEKYFEWTDEKHNFCKYNIKILTGDIKTTDSQRKALVEADIIILTPEMFNSKCRFYDKHKWLSNTVFIGDEIHLIGLDGRGDSEEVGIIQYFENDPGARALFLSATLPNVDDFGKWLDHMTGRPSVLLRSSYRPCKLNKVFVPFQGGGSYASTEENRMDKVVELVQKYKDESILIFTGSKNFGYMLSSKLKRLNIDNRFHSADLSRDDKKITKDGEVSEGRRTIEEGFKDGKFNVLIATTTMAWGCFSEDTFVKKTESEYGKISESKNGKVVSFGRFDRKESRSITKIVSDNKIGMKRIVLKSGLTIICTEDHSFPTYSGEEKKASELTYSDNLIVDNLIKYNDKFKNLSKGESYLIGLIAGDGHLSKKSLDICIPDKDIQKKAKEILKESKFEYRISKNGYDEIDHIVSDKKCRDFFREYVFYSSKKEKVIDFNLLGVDDEKLFNILAGLMDSDGGVDSNKICFYNTSYHLVNFFVLSMKKFGIETSVRLRDNFSTSLIVDKKGIQREIKGKKKCYEISIGSSCGFIFFKNNIISKMRCNQRIRKIENNYQKTYYGIKSKMENESHSVSVYGLRNEKTFNLIKESCLYCLNNNGAFLSQILCRFNKKRLFMRKDNFLKFFNVSTRKYKGKNRKFYYPNIVGKLVSESKNYIDFIDILISNGFFTVDKKLRKLNKDNINYFSHEKIRYITEEHAEEIVFDLSIQENEHHHYIANGIVVHNCNTPARYVIQSHTKFGLTPMHPSNIIQAIGRAGRTGWSDRGDALILCPSHEIKKEEKRIFSGYQITSTLHNLNVLMFHVLSYIYDGTIKDNRDLYSWYRNTLASVQGDHITPEKCTLILENLRSRGMIVCKEGEYTTTKLGEITARMYMSPLDVSDWFRNFAKLERIKSEYGATDREKVRDNILIAQALARCYTWGKTWRNDSKTKESFLVDCNGVYISEREKNSDEVLELCSILQTPPADPNMKYVALFYRLLSGREVGPILNSYYMTISQDIERIITTLHQCDMMVGRYFHKKDPLKVPGFDWGADWRNLKGRLKYGVPAEIAELVGLPNIGKKRAEKLSEYGVSTLDDFTNPSNKDRCERAIGKKTYQKTLLMIE